MNIVGRFPKIMNVQVARKSLQIMLVVYVEILAGEQSKCNPQRTGVFVTSFFLFVF